MREEELFSTVLERMRWSDQRCAHALDVDIELIEPCRTGQRCVPERIMDMLLKFAAIHLPNWTPPALHTPPSQDSGNWTRDAFHTGPGAEHQTGSYAPDSEAYDAGPSRPLHEMEEEPRQVRRSYKRLATQYARLLRELGPGEDSGFGPYLILGVQPGDDWETIRGAYRSLARVHHPDRGGDPGVMQEVTEAYAELRRIFET